MPDHKFEPGKLVLVRDSDEKKWNLKHFSHVGCGEFPFYTTDGGCSWRQCIPFNDETKSLLNRTNAYEPPNPPKEYRWGDKVEVLRRCTWDKGLYICCVPINQLHRVYTDKHGDGLFSYAEIRPLQDSAAQ